LPSTGRAGRIGGATVAAAVVPVWARTLDEFRAPFEAGAGSFAGLELERAELFRLDNPYWHDNPAVFARDYVQSVTAWGGPLLLRAFAREGEDRALTPVGWSTLSESLAAHVCGQEGRSRWQRGNDTRPSRWCAS